MSQLPLDLQFMTADGRDDFIVSDCNRVAAGWIDSWPDWPGQFRALNLVGPAASGKSHLAAVWRTASNAVHLDHLADGKQLSSNIIPSAPTLPDQASPSQTTPDRACFVIDHPSPGDGWHEESLFHLFNHVAQADGSLLILSREPVTQMGWRLADLASRLRSCIVARLEAPDDALLHGLLEKYFYDRQLAVNATVVDYMVTRMERSFAAVQTIAAAMDRASLAQRRDLTMPLAREIMTAFAEGQHARQAVLPTSETSDGRETQGAQESPANKEK